MERVVELAAADAESVLQVWESAVRATHGFLTNSDIQELFPLVREGITEVADLVLVRNEPGQICGFMGVEGVKVEMLFIAMEYRGLGIGRKLMEYAFKEFGVYLVDVNEQNIQAFGFYRCLGFEIFSRSTVDSRGAPFPILHLRRSG